jgi:hypothetical protein
VSVDANTDGFVGRRLDLRIQNAAVAVAFLAGGGSLCDRDGLKSQCRIASDGRKRALATVSSSAVSTGSSLLAASLPSMLFVLIVHRSSSGIGTWYFDTPPAAST